MVISASIHIRMI